MTLPPPVDAAPGTLAQVAAASDSKPAFHAHLCAWLQRLKALSTRGHVIAALHDEPELLGARFSAGVMADACLAAVAEAVACALKAPAPTWAEKPERFLQSPASMELVPPARPVGTLKSNQPDASAAFLRRNLYGIAPVVVLGVRRGRPTVPAEHKQAANAARQRRFRERRAAELESLRRAAARLPLAATMPPPRIPAPPPKRDIVVDLSPLL